MSSNLKIEPVVRDPSAGPVLINNHAENPAYSSASYASHSRSPSDGQEGNRASPIVAAHPVPHGYNHVPPGQNEAHIHPELRSSSDPAPSNSAYPPVPGSNMMAATLPPLPNNQHIMSGPLAPIGGSPEDMDTGDSTADGRKAKRELSQSKRAAQNRAAQRAFRQRKEGYIKKLEQQVRELADMEANYKTMQTENYALREYVIHLQSRLLDALGEYPQPPPNVNLQPVTHGQSAPPAAPEPSQPAVSGNPIEVAAQAVAGLNRSEHLATREQYKAYDQAARADDDARTAEELTRQLADGTADGLPTAPM